MDQVLIKGTVEHISPVFEHREEKEGENDRINGRDTEGEAMRATEARRGDSKKRVKYFQVHLQEGIILKASRVIVATGPTRAQMANIPSWVKGIGESYPEESLQHTVHLMHQLPAARQKQETDSEADFTLYFNL